ncbi:MAG: NAD(P)-dependent dehydrogenase (short-subunit alcohol dehydrogenase family) [Myxococcota bacterium]|jgi:NAD(P)-dependent dehydrogenase (short-subunit alcohol dehydrogenase family)
MSANKPCSSYLITGANGGLGKDAARQLALLPGTNRVVLACRSEAKALAAKAELEAATGKHVFEVLLMDTSDVDSVRAAVEALAGPVDGVILNAGGPGGASAGDKTRDGVVLSFAVNVLGHVALVEGLIAAGKLNAVVAFVSSEAARGIPAMGMKRPALSESSVDDFAAIADGSGFRKFDAMEAYGPIKYVGTMWASAMARRHPDIRFVSVSPGATSGTNAADQVSAVQRFVFTRIAYPLMTLFGRAHGLEQGAKRYVDVVTDPAFESGAFYASPWPSTSGELIDQSTIFEDLANPQFQDNAYQAVHRFLPA